MENYTWNPPIWKRWPREKPDFTYTCIRIPDWNCVGPMIAAPKGDCGSSNTICHDEAMASTQKLKYRFMKMKDISQKFPLERTKKFAYPVTRPRDVLRPIIRYLELNNFLFRQGANAIDIIDLQGKTYAVHPSCGTLLAGILISEILPGTFEDNMEKSNENVFCHLKYHNRLVMKATSDVYQIIAKEVNGTGMVINRSLHAVQFYSLKEDLKINNTLYLSHFKNPDKPILTSVALSDTLPGCFATARACGIVSVYDNPDQKNIKPIWENSFSADGKCVYQCDFGRRAFSSLIVNNRSSVWHCDTRSKPVEITNNSAQSLFDLETIKNSLEGTDIICKVARNGWCYLYVVTSSSILLMDERYCKIPAMKWDHTLPSCPSFLTQTKIKDLEVSMLGNSHDYRVGAVAYNSNTKGSWSGSPKYFDIVRDTMQFAHQQNIWFNHQINCVGNNFIGLASYVNPFNDSSLCLLALNESGDIFLQDFHISNDNVDFTEDFEVTNSCDEIGKKLLETWEKNAVDLAIKQSDRTRENQFFDSEDSKIEGTESIEKPQNLVSYYNELEKSFYSREMNLKGNKMLWNFQNYVISNFTCVGNRDVDLVMNDTSCDSNTKDLENYIPHELSRHIKPDFYKNCTDKFSCSVLDVWLGSIESEGLETERPSVEYRSAPFDIDRVLVLPKKLKLQWMDDFASPRPVMSDSFSPSQNSESLLWSPQKSAESKDKKRKLKKRIDGF